MFKPVLEKADEPEIKLPTSVGSSKKQATSRKTSTCALLTMPKPLTVWITTNCGKFWKRWAYQTTLCLLRNLYAGQEATVRTRHGTMDWFQIGKGVRQGCILPPYLFNFYADYIRWNAKLEEAQAGIKIAGRNINNLRYADDTTLMTEREEELKSLLMKVKEKSERAGLKLNTQKTKIMASCPTPCDPMNRSTPGLPVHHQLPEFTQTHVHWVGDAIQPSHPLSSPSLPALNLSQHRGLLTWVSSSHQVAKVLEFQLQHQSFQWTPRTDLL